MTEHIGMVDAIRYQRIKKGLSPRALSLKAGLSASYVGKLERQEIEPSIGVFARIALVLDMNPRETFYCIRMAAMERESS